MAQHKNVSESHAALRELALRAQIRNEIARLNEGLELHAVNGKADWGHVGDLAHVADKLAELARFIRNEDAPA